MKPLSERTTAFTESVIREMTRVCDAAGGYNLAQGFPDFGAPPEVKRAAVEAIAHDRNQYSITFGEAALRRAIAQKCQEQNGIACDPETEVTVTCGATEAMVATMMALVNPGDEIVVFEPFYENYGPDAILAGATPRYVTLRPPDWYFDPRQLAAAFSKRTKAVVVNTPNNPTGKVFTRSELEAIASLCLKHDCYAVTDEIYEHILYDGAEHVSLATLPDMAERTVTINSISKSYCVTGWRLGWAVAPAPITARIRKAHDFLTVAAPTPFQDAAVTALSLPPEYYARLRRRYDEARRFMLDVLARAGFIPFAPQGAYYIMADAARVMERLGARDDVAFARRLVEVAGVAAVPGSAFYSERSRGRRQVRFCFCKKAETLRGVRSGLERALRS